MSVCAVVAADPVHEEMSWLNAEANLNIYIIKVTSCAVFQLPMSWLNAEASRNFLCVPYSCDSLFLCSNSNVLVECRSEIKHSFHRVTFSVFQLPMSWLNAEAS